MVTTFKNSSNLEVAVRKIYNDAPNGDSCGGENEWKGGEGGEETENRFEGGGDL